MITAPLQLDGKTRACDWVVSLDAGAPLKEAGGKAHQLGRLRRLGVGSPPGLVITRRAFEAFLEENQLRARISEALERLDLARPESFETAARTIREWVLGAELPAGLKEGLAKARRQQGTELPFPWIVRSSAVGEDGGDASFAGQLDSLPGLKSIEEAMEAIRRCWASYWSARALFYQRSGRGRLDGMGVVAQPYLAAAVSGVLFTRTPDGPGGRANEMLGEYCFGPGEALVSGRVNPGRFGVNRETLGIRWDAAPEETNQDGDQDRPGRRVWEEAPRILAELARCGLRLEERLGGPQDLEWVVTLEGRLNVVQARPITALRSGVNAGERQGGGREEAGRGAARRPEVRWSNANVNENFPEPMSPLLYSIAAAGYAHYFRNLALAFGIAPRRVARMERPMSQIIGAHGGRMYYNLTSIHEVLHLAPGGERLAAYFDLFVGAEGEAGREPETERGPKAGRWTEAWEWARIAWNTGRQYARFTKRVERFEARVECFCDASHPRRLPGRSMGELVELLRRFMDIRRHEWTEAGLADAAAMTCYGLLRGLLARAFPEKSQAGLHNSLLKGLPGLVSGIPPLLIWEMSRSIRGDSELNELFARSSNGEILRRIRQDASLSRFREKLEAFLEEWGFRFSGELMLTAPGYDERPEELIDLLRAYCAVENGSPHETLATQARDRVERTEALCRELKRRPVFGRWTARAEVLLFRLLVKSTQTAVGLRERARLKQAKLYNRCRKIILAMGERLAGQGMLEAREDLFYFTWQEIEALCSGGAMFPYHSREEVAARKRRHAEISAMRPPPSFTLPEGGYLPLGELSQGRGDAASEPGAAADEGNRWQGLSACGGQATAPAAVLKNLSEARHLQPGQILVTAQTDPGWSPVFFLIKGLVLERGGMLSHGAIIAREYGIPAVVGVPRATERIRAGQVVRVDGDHGYVEGLERGAGSEERVTTDHGPRTTDC